MNILAFESSCDETAAAVVRDGRTVLSDVVASQADMHAIYGGVVPEIASRKHIEAVAGLADAALERAGVCARVCLVNCGEAFVPHGALSLLKQKLELDGAGIARRALEVLGRG